LDLEDVFTFNEGDIIRCFAYYQWTQSPTTPVNPANFSLVITACDLSLIAWSTDKPGEAPNLKPPKTDELKVDPPYATQVELYKFKPGLSGLHLVNVRMNIKSLLCYDAKRKDSFPTVGVRWQGWLSLNGGGDKNCLTLQTICNQPNLIVGGTVWPSIMELYFLANLKETDEVSVMAYVDDIFILHPPNIFDIITEGSLPMTIQFTPRCSHALHPQIQTFPEYNDTVILDIEGKMQEFPVDGQVFQVPSKHSHLFRIQDGQLVLKSHHTHWFRVRANLIISQILLTNANKDPGCAVSQNLGFAIGVNGARVNDVAEVNFTYSDKMFLHKWMATQSAENVVQLKPGDRISPLVWTTDVHYLAVPTNAKVIIPVLTSPAGSTINLTGKITFVVEDA